MLETLLLGLVANEVNTPSIKENDVNRFKEICNGSPLTPMEEVAVTALVGQVLGGQQANDNPIASIMGQVLGGGQQADANPLTALLGL